MPLSHRFYLSDAVFVAAVGGDTALLEGLDEALRSPEFPLFLGRRSCPPSQAIGMGVVDGDPRMALTSTDKAPWQASAQHRRRSSTTVLLEVVVDAVLCPGADDHISETRRDVPISFSPLRREYGWRDVVHLPQAVSVDNPDGRMQRDFFETVRGA